MPIDCHNKRSPGKIQYIFEELYEMAKASMNNDWAVKKLEENGFDIGEIYTSLFYWHNDEQIEPVCSNYLLWACSRDYSMMDSVMMALDIINNNLGQRTTGMSSAIFSDRTISARRERFLKLHALVQKDLFNRNFQEELEKVMPDLLDPKLPGEPMNKREILREPSMFLFSGTDKSHLESYDRMKAIIEAYERTSRDTPDERLVIIKKIVEDLDEYKFNLSQGFSQVREFIQNELDKNPPTLFEKLKSFATANPPKIEEKRRPAEPGSLSEKIGFELPNPELYETIYHVDEEELPPLEQFSVEFGKQYSKKMKAISPLHGTILEMQKVNIERKM